MRARGTYEGKACLNTPVFVGAKVVLQISGNRVIVLQISGNRYVVLQYTKVFFVVGSIYGYNSPFKGGFCRSDWASTFVCRHFSLHSADLYRKLDQLRHGYDLQV